MKRRCLFSVFAVLVVAVCTGGVPTPAAEKELYTRQEDVIYGRKDGMALTMDVFTPKKDPNGAAVVWVVSGGFLSSHDCDQGGLRAASFSIAATRSSPWSTAASRGTRSPTPWPT